MAPKISTPRRVKHDEKWEIHKPLLARLYLEEKLKLPKIQTIMKEQYDFPAEVHHYKYRFQKWEWEKSLSTVKKNRILEIGQKRAAEGRTTAITHQKRKIRGDLLLRAAQERDKRVKLLSKAHDVHTPAFMSQSGLGLQIGFFGWNLPQQYLLRNGIPVHNHPSPFDTSSTPPSDISMQTPPDTEAMSPSLIRAVSSEAAQMNADRLMSGDLGALLRSLDGPGRRTMADWMDQFWLSAFLTAKNWGSHKTLNTNKLISYTRLADLTAPSPQGHAIRGSPYDAPSPRQDSRRLTQLHNAMQNRLCKWTIHVLSSEWEMLDGNLDHEHAGGSTEAVPPTVTFDNMLQDALQTNSFSIIREDDLPINLSRVSEITAASSLEVFQEGFKFAIMSRNIELVTEMLNRADSAKFSIETIQPLHLALTFLDGARSCCQIFRMLLENYAQLPHYLRAVNEPDQLGLSLFDTLMIHIIRNHTNCFPNSLGEGLVYLQDFGGKEVDCCGRWDADSLEYRQLVQSGSRIPSSWKHKFCHTSTQMVCHSLKELGKVTRSYKSGSLFLRRCFACGLKMQLPPIHILVLTAWHVAQYGAEEEDLFGMVCVLLCVAAASPPDRRSDLSGLLFSKAHVDTSFFEVEGSSSADYCAHEKLWPSELTQKLPASFPLQERPLIRNGWSVFCEVLRQIEVQYRKLQLEGDVEETDKARDGEGNRSQSQQMVDAGVFSRISTVFWDEPEAWSEDQFGNCEHFNVEIPAAYGQNMLLGHLWAVCQTELLTYRRRQLGRQWTSPQISIGVIERYLMTGCHGDLPLVREGVLLPYCLCGRFSGIFAVPRREQACSASHGSLDDGNCAAYVDDSGFLDEDEQYLI